MSLWDLVSKVPPEKLQQLYVDFPQHMRHLLGDWLENQPWEFLTGSDSFCYNMASALLSATVQHLQALVGEQGEGNALLPHISTLENIYQREPLKLVAACKQILQGEKKAVMEKFRHLPMSYHWKQEELKFNTALQRLRHQVGESRLLREDLQQEALGDPGSLSTLMKRRANGTGSREKLVALLQEAVGELELAKGLVLKRLHIWKRQQQLAGNGAPFDESLAPLQERCESLVDIYFQLQQELGAAGGELEPKARASLLGRLDEVLQSLVTSSFLVEKQPPQVLKTQTKFQAGVRFLLGLRFLGASAKLPLVRADMVTEKQARELSLPQASGATAESTGEIMNNTVSLENSIPGSCCSALFKNLLLKKIKRCERKGTESVTEEKCAVLFSTSFTLGPNKLPVQLQALSLPLVVIVHGNQDNNAKATILWDNAFSEMERVPFVVSERVPWEKMCETLNLKFMSEVGTSQGLHPDHFLFLAQKIFNDNSLSTEAFQHRSVSWSQFNKEILLGRGFTFWQWFDGVLDLTKRCLRSYWSDGLIIGFISKQYVTNLLLNQPDGTFLLRFSDSEIGGITIAHVIRGQDGSSQIENIQPFSAKDLSIRSLGDRIRDLPQLKNLYPNKPKDEAFRNHYKPEQMGKDGRGYVPATIKMTVESCDQTLPTSEPQMPPGVPSYGIRMNPSSSVNVCSDMSRVFLSPSHPHSPYPAVAATEDRVLHPFPDTHLPVHPMGQMTVSFDPGHTAGQLSCQPEHAVASTDHLDVPMTEDGSLNRQVPGFPPGTWTGEDLFPPLFPPTDQDLNTLLQGQAEASAYGQPGMALPHLDLGTNPSW